MKYFRNKMLIGLFLFTGVVPYIYSQPKAKSVILVYLDGGPSQTDTFDPKPEAGRDYYGPYKNVQKTNVPGIEIGEKLALLAKIANKYSLIRSLTHGTNAHETGHYRTITGDMSGGTIVYPAFGAVIAYFKEKEYKGKIPSYVSITAAASRFNESGFLGARFKSFDTGGAPEKPQFSVEGIVNKALSDKEQVQRCNLLSVLDSLSGQVDDIPEVKQLLVYRKNSYDLILGDAREAFDLTQEPDSLRTRYGMTRFGQSCLLARRLVENGVPFVNVRFTGWDTHKEHFARMDARLEDLDKGLFALLSDLSERGLLDSTIVLCGGEFGRTPRIMWEPPWNGGRGHFGDAFSYLVAGGGFSGGKVVGETDSKGLKVVDRPVYPCDLIGSVYQLLGIDPYGSLPHPLLGKVPLLPSLKKDREGGLLNEIMKSR